MISAGRASKDRPTRVGGASSTLDPRSTHLGVGTWTGKEDIPKETKAYLQEVEKRDIEMEEIELTRVGQQVNELKDVAIDINQRIKGQEVILDPISDVMAGHRQQLDDINIRLKAAAKKGKHWGSFGRNLGCMLLLVGQLSALGFTIKYVIQHS